jgi:hypothetical protein
MTLIYGGDLTVAWFLTTVQATTVDFQLLFL